MSSNKNMTCKVGIKIKMDEARKRSRENYLKGRVAKQIEQLSGKIRDKQLLAEQGITSELENIELQNLQKTIEYVQKYGDSDKSLGIDLKKSTESGSTLKERLKSAGQLAALQEQFAPNLKKETTWEAEKMQMAYSEKNTPAIFTLEPRDDMVLKKIDYSDVQQSLPVYKHKDVLLNALVTHKVLVVVGDTGSGKSTQIPQYLLDLELPNFPSSNQNIVCTQPRRVAAMSVAARVAAERHVELGFEVGYAVRFDDKRSEFTKITYMTDGVLLREFLVDPELRKYTTIMIDEAHERSVSTDILLSLLRDLVEYRNDESSGCPPLRLIVASATLDAESMSKYFNNCPVLTVRGRRFTVNINYSTAPVVDYEQAALETALKIHRDEDLVQPCDILVFLTGQDEIDRCVEKVNELVSLKQLNNIEALPLYSALPSEKQQMIFKPAPYGTRKVIFSTNIAETSITIDTVKFVIDCGLSKEAKYDAVSGVGTLDRTPISKSSADQRAGRAGRTSEGWCYRLYTSVSFETEHPQMTTPEIKRCDLAPIILFLTSLGISDIAKFKFIDAPSSENVIAAYNTLRALQAYDDDGNLTEMGQQMSQLPVSPMCAHAIIKSFSLGCSSPVITICSVLECGSPLFFYPKGEQKDAIAHIKQFYDEDGDHIVCLNVFNQWKEADYAQTWCQGNRVQYRSLISAQNIQQQLSDLCQLMNLTEDKKDESNENITKAFAHGFFMNSARLMTNGFYQTLKGLSEAKIHPSSCLHSYTPQEYVIFYELVMTSDLYMRTVMKVRPNWLIEIAPRCFVRDQNGVSFRKMHRM